MRQDVRPIAPSVIDDAVLAALEEDGAYNDVTTLAVVHTGAWGRGTFLAKQEGVIAGLGVAAAAMTALSDEVSFDAAVQDGDCVSDGTELAEVEGPLPALLTSERVALNFLQRMSGVATLTRAYVEAVDGTDARILDTRKTTPGLRHFERYAVRVGGGHNHRFSLADAVLIKDNHIAAAWDHGAADLGEIIAQARARAPHTARIEIEVTTQEECQEAVAGGADIILLDNMPLEEVRACALAVAGGAVLEVSGGVTLENVGAIARAGVQFISVGRLTHSAPSIDISLRIGRV